MSLVELGAPGSAAGAGAGAAVAGASFSSAAADSSWEWSSPGELDSFCERAQLAVSKQKMRKARPRVAITQLDAPPLVSAQRHSSPRAQVRPSATYATSPPPGAADTETAAKPAAFASTAVSPPAIGAI